jgi:probable HAF family extracellular repeat protein
MKSPRLSLAGALGLLAALVPLQLAGQNGAKPRHQYHHYQLIDVGTFGGPQSFQNLGGPAVGVLNNRGAFGGWADTSSIDPLCFFDFPDCYVAHAFVWQGGAKTDLGVLPGGLNSQVQWVSANGLMTGVADNGQFDPLIGIPQIRGTFWGHDGEISDVGSLPGAYFANPLAVNNRGQVVGATANTIPDPNSMWGIGYQTRAFLWDSKEGMQDLGTLPGGTDALAGMINDQGQIVGWSYINSVPSGSCPGIGGPVLTTDSFIWDKKNGMRDLGSLGGTCTLAYDFNARGQIVGGSAPTGDTAVHPFVWESAAGITDLLGSSNVNFGNAISIGSSGVVVGGTCDSVTCYALLWKKSGGTWQMTDLGDIDGGAFAIAINSSEQVVGNTNTGTFIWENGGSMVNLSTLISSNSGIQLNEIGRINDRGEISANGSDASGNNHDVLLIPCDENHPDVAGCDYDLIDAETAAARSSQNPTQPPAAATPGNPVPGLLNRFRSPTNQRVPGHAPAPEASLAVPATPDTGDWLGDHQLVPQDGNPQYGNPSPYCAISNGTLTGTCVQSTGAYNCNLTFSGCPMGQPASGNYSYLCDGGHSYVAISSTKCFSVPGFDVSTTALTPTTVPEGGSATSTLTVSAYGGFGGAVTFTCSVQPTAAPAPTCLFSPRSVTSGTPVTLTVTTTAPTSALRRGTRSGLLYAFLLPLSGLFAMVLRFGPQQKRDRRITAAAFAGVLFAGVVFQAACGAKPPTPGTPAGEYSITVTGTSGTLVNSFIVLPLTVQ